MRPAFTQHTDITIFMIEDDLVGAKKTLKSAVFL
jgi:hypothetical protein